MTGFGRSEYENELREYLVEIKSVKNRYNDISIKTSRSISYLEDKIRQIVQKSVSRGKIDVFVSFVNNSEKGRDIKLNTELAKTYIKELKKLSGETGITDSISIMEITKLPDIFSISIKEDDEELIWKELLVCLNKAISAFIKMRETEGERIKQDLDRRIKIIIEKTEKIITFSTGLVQEYIVKLERRINEILKYSTIDEARLALEVVVYSDKSSI
jgi:uncharacterized protein (TIGR00255 family)